jgi:phosphoglycolate phosphatase
VTTAAAGQWALARAFQQLFGVRGALDAVEIAGRTDPLIVRDALAGQGLHADAAHLDLLRAVYFQFLADELRTSKVRLLPGVERLLVRLGARADTVLALLTGNYARSAQLKLEHCGLWHLFAFGVFGDEAPDRNGLLPVALARARARDHVQVLPAHTVVIGDTPYDVACARAGGARSLAVATGRSDEATLQAAGADHVLLDLSDTDDVLAVLDALVAPRPSS